MKLTFTQIETDFNNILIKVANIDNGLCRGQIIVSRYPMRKKELSTSGETCTINGLSIRFLATSFLNAETNPFNYNIEFLFDKDMDSPSAKLYTVIMTTLFTDVTYREHLKQLVMWYTNTNDKPFEVDEDLYKDVLTEFNAYIFNYFLNNNLRNT
jgi:uncharacterized membrane-anchored protein YitT (DUF2179 family)